MFESVFINIKKCSLSVEACDSAPCQNGGVCFRGSGGANSYFCQCTEGYTGVNCQTRKGHLFVTII